ncbi:MAG TPA: transposase [Candidatus Acidoferrales bacterium]|nr:transposase [Candidatus Acidoferrales bacterium]
MPGTPNLEVDFGRAAAETERMDQAPYHLDQIRRDALLEVIQEVCAHRGSRLLAAHVRSNHVHTVVEAGVLPERVMSDCKAYGRRRLNQMGLDEPNRKRWARHGSTRWRWKPQHVSAAIQYIVSEQGEVRHPLPKGRATSRGSAMPSARFYTPTPAFQSKYPIACFT